MYHAGNPKPMLCDGLEVWGGEEGGFKIEETYVYLMLVHADV